MLTKFCCWCAGYFLLCQLKDHGREQPQRRSGSSSNRGEPDQEAVFQSVDARNSIQATCDTQGYVRLPSGQVLGGKQKQKKHVSGA